MNNLVTILDFSGRYALPDQGFAIDNFNTLIADLQFDFLLNILGIDLYQDFEANPTDPKWIDFVVGKKYLSCKTGTNLQYTGIKNVLVPYIYSIFVENNQYHVLNTATVKANNQNSTITDDFDLKRIVYKSWNNFIDKYYLLYDFLYTNEVDYPNFCDYFRKLVKKSFIEKHSIR